MSRTTIAAGVAALGGLVLLSTLVFIFWPTTPEEPLPLAVVPAPAAPSITIASTTGYTTIGESVEKRTISAYTFGTGSTTLLFVGGVHGGYEWNSILLAYETIDWLTTNPSMVPPGLTIHVIPNLNPDGLFAATGLVGRFSAEAITSYDMHTTGAGRFNANRVDLNRNFNCKWQPTGSWRGRAVSAGTAPFSEPEARSLRDYVFRNTPAAVVFWHSQANTVYASECEAGVLPETLVLMNTYASAAGYGAVASFDAYPVTGDAEGWLASIGIPAITVELEGRLTTEWSRNQAALTALFVHYGGE